MVDYGSGLAMAFTSSCGEGGSVVPPSCGSRVFVCVNFQVLGHHPIPKGIDGNLSSKLVSLPTCTWFFHEPTASGASKQTSNHKDLTLYLCFHVFCPGPEILRWRQVYTHNTIVMMHVDRIFNAHRSFGPECQDVVFEEEEPNRRHIVNSNKADSS